MKFYKSVQTVATGAAILAPKDLDIKSECMCV